MVNWLVSGTLFVSVLFGSAVLEASPLESVDRSDLSGCPFHKLESYAQQTDSLKEQHLQYFRFPKDNGMFARRWRDAKPQKNILFVHIENMVLKLLNDKVLEDKQVSAALLNMYKRVFYEELVKRPSLEHRIISADDGGVYSDFKIVRLAIHVTSSRQLSETIDLVDEVHRATAQRFFAMVRSYPGVYAKLHGRIDLTRSPSLWHQAGAGATPEQAARVAAEAKHHSAIAVGVDEAPVIPLQVFGRTAAARVVKGYRDVNLIQRSLEAKLSNRPMASPILDKDGVLSYAALEIFKNAKTDKSIRNKSDYIQHIQTNAWLRFGVHLSGQEVEQIQTYYHQVDALIASLYIVEDEPIHLAEMKGATHGVLSFDMEGAGLAKLREAMKTLKIFSNQHHHEKAILPLANEILAELRQTQDRVSQNFLATRDLIGRILKKRGLLKDAAHLTKSGDEVTALLCRTLSPKELNEVMADYRDIRNKGLRVRATYQPQTYVDSTIAIDPSTRFELVSRLETVQKEMRKKLQKEIPQLWRRGALAKVQVSLAASPISPERIGVTILLHFEKDVSPDERQKVERAIRTVVANSPETLGGTFLQGVKDGDDSDSSPSSRIWLGRATY